MRAPELRAVVERRILVNYRIDAGTAARCLPRPFRPALRNGWAVGGLCLIRLGGLGLGGPAALRPSESIALRIAACWDTPAGETSGVFVLRRETDAALHRLAGGRLYPGVHHAARVALTTADGLLSVRADGKAGRTSVTVQPGREQVDSRLFADAGDATSFFRSGAVGCSPRRRPGSFDALMLDAAAFALDDARPVEVSSWYFDDPARFPPGTATLDSAFTMRPTAVRWRALERVAAT